MKKHKLDEMQIDGYKAYYAVIDRGDGIRCAWCERLLSEFKNEHDHIILEDALAKIESKFNGEELLYGDFQKIKKEILT